MPLAALVLPASKKDAMVGEEKENPDVSEKVQAAKDFWMWARRAEWEKAAEALTYFVESCAGEQGEYEE